MKTFIAIASAFALFVACSTIAHAAHHYAMSDARLANSSVVVGMAKAQNWMLNLVGF